MSQVSKTVPASKDHGGHSLSSSESSDSGRLREERARKLELIKEAGINPYPYKFTRTHLASELQKKYESLPAGSETEDVVSVCGRIMNERNSWMFIDLLDGSGKIQLFCHKENLGEADLKQ